MAPQEPIRKRPTGPVPMREIPDKLYFRIGEVAKLCEVPAYVLRFWEGEFPQLKPNKGGTGQRLYRRRDVEMALRIKTLLYNEGYTIPGARQAFKAELRSNKDVQAAAATGPQMVGQPGSQIAGQSAAAPVVDTRHLQALQKELREIHALLARPATARSAVQAIRTPRAAVVKAPGTPPAPTPFPRPLMMEHSRRRQHSDDAFVNSLFDDLPPMA